MKPLNFKLLCLLTVLFFSACEKDGTLIEQSETLPGIGSEELLQQTIPGGSQEYLPSGVEEVVAFYQGRDLCNDLTACKELSRRWAHLLQQKANVTGETQYMGFQCCRRGRPVWVTLVARPKPSVDDSAQTGAAVNGTASNSANIKPFDFDLMLTTCPRSRVSVEAVPKGAYTDFIQYKWTIDDQIVGTSSSMDCICGELLTVEAKPEPGGLPRYKTVLLPTCLFVEPE